MKNEIPTAFKQICEFWCRDKKFPNTVSPNGILLNETKEFELYYCPVGNFPKEPRIVVCGLSTSWNVSNPRSSNAPWMKKLAVLQ